MTVGPGPLWRLGEHPISARRLALRSQPHGIVRIDEKAYRGDVVLRDCAFQFLRAFHAATARTGSVPRAAVTVRRRDAAHAEQERFERGVEEINSSGGELFDVLRAGETVLVHSGPFAGYEAIFDLRLPGTERVRVLLKLLRNRNMPVELPAGYVRPKK